MPDPVATPTPGTEPAPGSTPAAPPAPLLGTPASGDPPPGAPPAAPDASKTPGQSSAPAPPTGAPEKYDFKLASELPPVDPAVLGKFEPAFRDLNLTNDQATKLVDAYARHVVGETQARTEALAKQVGDWNKQIEADPALGGAAFQDNVKLAIAAVDRVGGRELADLLAQTGLGSHPTVFKAFLEVGKLFKEDSMMPTGGAAAPTGERKSTAEVLWGVDKKP